MVASNLAAEVLAGSQPFLLRLYGSFAAALFITISGMMVYHTAKTKGYGARHFLLRGGLILLVGVLVDVLIWRIYPFTTVDVLYLIGVSIPIAYLLSRASSRFRWTIVVIIFLATPILQSVLGYTRYPTELTLLGQPTIIVPNQTSVLNHWIIDGWFPLFPWLGFSILGVNIAESRLTEADSPGFKSKNTVLVTAVLLLCLGIATWLLYPGPLMVRSGYAELFYPPTVGYIATASGLFILLLLLVDRSRSAFLYRPLNTLGESSLFMYILHLMLIVGVFALLLPDETLQVFLISYLALTIMVVIVAYGLRVLKARRRNLPFLLRFLIGS
jgi:uncharacterized membrane protein